MMQRKILLLSLLAAGAACAQSAFTIALKMKPEPSMPDGTTAGMIGHLASGWYDGCRLEAFLTVNGFSPALEIGRPEGAWMLKAPTCALPAGTWSHVAATWDGRTARIYVNGRVVAEDGYAEAFTQPRGGGQGAFAFVKAPAYGLLYYPFERQDAFFARRALSADEVKARVGTIEPPNKDAVARQRKLFRTSPGVTFEPTDEDLKKIAEERAACPADVVGPAPDLPAANPPAAVASTRFFVAPNGDDANPGTRERPFATLARARDAVRALKRGKGLPKDGVTVFVRGGAYPVASTFELTAEDSGAPGAPVLYAAYGDEKPVFSSGFAVRNLQPADHERLPASARGKVLVADVRAQGYAHFEPMPSYGFGAGENTGRRPLTDLYCDGRRLPLARWPDEGWRKLLGGNTTNSAVRVELDDWAKWAKEPSLMITMYPSWLWADLTCPVTNLDAQAGLLYTAGRPDRHRFTRIRSGYPYFLVNALCALDREGEWYLDRAAGRLYVWPPAGAAAFTLSDFDGPFVSLKGVSDLEIRGLVFEHGRADAILGERLMRVTFARNTIRHFGNDGLHAVDSTRVTLRDNVLTDFGHGGLRLSGGDRRTLAPAGHVIVGNDISFVEQWKRTYAPGLLLFGCGTRIERNHFHDMRSSAMRLEGNDFLVASNLVEDVVLESDDQGGIDIYANPTFAVRIVGNVWRNIGRGGEFAPCGQAGVRFDDRVSNMLVEGNRFENCSWGHFGAIQMNGGRNNTVRDNVFIDCAKSVSISQWTQSRWQSFMASREAIYRMTQEVDVYSEPYRSRYPGIDRLKDMPLANRFWGNVLVGDTLPPPRCGGHTDSRANVAYERLKSKGEVKP